MKYVLLLFSLVISIVANSQNNNSSSENINQKKYNLLDFGAIGDGKADDSGAFLRALSAVSKTPSKKS